MKDKELTALLEANRQATEKVFGPDGLGRPGEPFEFEKVVEKLSAWRRKSSTGRVAKATRND
jgi:hypothetical protein